MKLLIRKATLHHKDFISKGKTDILVDDGIIKQIASSIDIEADKEISSPDLHVSAGWMDIFADFADPGFEYKETLVSGAEAAASGGFTAVCVIPNTEPAISSKTQVEYISRKASSLPVDIYPIGAVTRNIDGKDLAEMYDMHAAGAIAFSDGRRPLQSPGVMLKALQYVLANDTVIIQVPDDKSIGKGGLMHEGITSTRHGLPGKPAIAEELMIHRDLELLRYTGSKLHITGVSTARGLEMIFSAQAGGLNVSCSVTPYHCWFCDEDLASYDTNLKVDPPLRSRSDMMALRKAVMDGKVAVASHHNPQHWDDKTCEFEYAKPGMISLQTVFPVLNSLGMEPSKITETLSSHSRKIFGLPVPNVKEGEHANLTIFDPSLEFTFETGDIRSISRNTPYTGISFKGKVLGTVCGKQINLQ